jgi:hypothetical protein
MNETAERGVAYAAHMASLSLEAVIEELSMTIQFDYTPLYERRDVTPVLQSDIDRIYTELEEQGS